jgi:hypothetical protein
MDMLTPVMEKLRQSTEADVRAIADATEIPAPTILKLKYGQTDNPRVRTVQRLYAHLFESQ